MKRAIVIILILAGVIGLSVGGYTLLIPKSYSVAEDPTVSEILTVETDTIIATVNGAGRLESIDNLDLTLGISGKVEAIYVSEGDYVEAGALLAELETTELAYALQLAEIELTKAQAQMEQLQLPPSEADLNSARASLDDAIIGLEELLAGSSETEIRAAQVALDSARANLEKVRRPPDSDSLIVAAANLRKAEVALQQAQSAYDAVAYDSARANAVAPQLEEATIDYETALANYNLTVKEADQADILAAQAQVAEAENALENLLLGVTPSQISAAQMQVVQAEANLQKLLEEPSEPDIILAQAAIDTAVVNLEKARYNLEQAQLRSPIAGTITAVNIEPDTIPKPEEPVIQIADLSTFKLVVDIDEIDINRIAVGQPVTINLDSLPEEEYTGHVEEIGLTPASDDSGGIVTYPITIFLDGQDSPFKVGMNVNVTIETERLEDVVVVENRAVEVDRQTGRTFVEKLIDDQTTERIEVILGRRSNNVSQVLEGLVAGDQIIIRERDRREELRRAIQGESN